MAMSVPLTPDEFDTSILENLIGTVYPGVRLASISVVDAALSSEGDQRVSTARRIAFDVTYADGSQPDLPGRLMVKVARPEFRDIPLYDNEVNVYTRIGNELPLRVPRSFGGVRDRASASFGLVLEDLRPANAAFENVLSPLGADDTAALLDQLALLHAAYWESSRFRGDLDWIQPHTSGPIHDLFSSDAGVALLIDHEVATHQFKRELVQSTGETTTSLRAQVARVQAHQATLPCTLLHGDAHVGNTYRLPNGQRGYLDLQLAARGFCMHDVSYTIVTSLNIDDRRAHERDLIAGYRRKLTELGIATPPPLDELFYGHRLAMAWCLYIGWLTSPTENYGWEITVANHIRISTAYRDLSSSAAIASLP
ncbi:MAG: phosphotransferase [Halioglobus sp.]